MSKSREQLAAEGALIVFQRMAAMREREKRAKQARTAPTAAAPKVTIDPMELVQFYELDDPTKWARAIIAAGDLARAGGPALPEPEGLAKQILAAGAKARRPMGDS